MSAVIVSSTRRCCGSPPPPKWTLCWRAKCSACGKWLTKHDHTREDAVAAADRHRCKEDGS